MWKIRLTLEGSLTHELGDVRSGKPGWAECQPSGIKRLEFPFIGKINGKDAPLTITLQGMEKYNFFVEAMRAIGPGNVKIKGLWFLGKLPGENRVVGYVIRDTCKVVNATFGKEYNGTGTVGWKTGKIGEKVICKIV